MKAHPQFVFMIEGHCDERDTIEYNLALGQRRAAATETYLADLNVAKDRLQTISYGKERPVCEGSSEDCWGKNRRAHFLVTERR
jgi:peptidoglycan-associated lipoprotein